jgi:hypothetical protein
MSRKMFAHVDLSSGKIAGVNSKGIAPGNRVAIELDYDLALKFIGGQENPNDWIAGLKDDKYVLQRIVHEQHSRVDLLPITEVEIDTWKPEEPTYIVGGVLIWVDREAGTLELCYDGDYLKTLNQPLKIYATREGDPSYLKCTISLDVNILNEIMYSNELDCWPNPLQVELADGTTDLSLFAPTASIVRAFEKPHA